ncbi:DUF2577 domain-containing protein [Paenibacillaceae bacterium]|nr:DUF2577 domain-containing protein [Paenibacillaceae bacterium]
MEKLLGTIKQAGAGAVDAAGPVAIVFGVVEEASPLAVRVDQRFKLTREFLIVPESLVHFELALAHTHEYGGEGGGGTATGTTAPALPAEPVVIRRGLEVGDKLLLLRMQGGQKYIILDRVVET